MMTEQTIRQDLVIQAVPPIKKGQVIRKGSDTLNRLIPLILLKATQASYYKGTPNNEI